MGTAEGEISGFIMGVVRGPVTILAQWFSCVFYFMLPGTFIPGYGWLTLLGVHSTMQCAL